MRPIKLYIAGSLGLTKEGDYPKQLLDETLPNRLVSFAYPTHLQEWVDLTGDAPGNVIIDSGAFSAWNKGDLVDLDEYIEYCHTGIELCEKANKQVRAVCLDVIPGKKGETANLSRKIGDREMLQRNKDLINKAAKEGYENMMRMKEAGITPIHVFHQGEDWKWLDKMLEQTDYIGISPANDMSNTSRNKWMKRVFTYLYKNGVVVKTHGFAVNSYEILKNMPWESCDAASWVLVAAYGKVFVPNGGYQKPDFRTKGMIMEVSSMIKKQKEGAMIDVSETKNGGIIKKNHIELLETSGYSISEILTDHNIRKLLNARYLHQMQDYLNEYKSKTEYKPLNLLV